MRGLLLAVLLAPPAVADTKLSVPDIVKEATTATGFVLQRESFPAIDGGTVAGIVIKPPNVDSAMVITPPDVNDPIFLELGTKQLRDRIPRTSWLPRDLSLGAKDAADAVWDLVLPKL